MVDFVFTVSEVNGYVKKVLESEDLLQNIAIRGEVSNLSKSISGHVYLTLKDGLASVQCVWFSGAKRVQDISLLNGDKVQVTADVTLYIKGGTYQLIIKDLKKDGIGDLYEKFEILKKKLEEEGLFEQANKKAIPEYPRIIGVITSEYGAAIQDIKKVISQSWGNCTMRLYPVSVQGENAAQQMIEAIDYFDTNQAADVIIIGRGGGSFEDLSCFNDERLARKIYGCKIPVISAVGHETDFTICDFVSDAREATPSTAAKRAVPNNEAELEKLSSRRNGIIKKLMTVLQEAENKLDKAKTRYIVSDPRSIIIQSRQQIDILTMKINSIIQKILQHYSSKLSENENKFNALNPRSILNRGYSIVKDKSGRIISTVNSAKSAGIIKILMSDGQIDAKVEEK